MAALKRGQSLEPFAFATAAWMRYCLGYCEDKSTYELRDPRQERIASSLKGISCEQEIASRLFALAGFLPVELKDDPVWAACVAQELARMLDVGVLGRLED